MNGRRRDAVIMVALALSLGLHVGLMLFVRSKVMTHVTSSDAHAVRHPPMRVVKPEAVPEPVRLEAVAELKALREAPAVQSAAEPPMDAKEFLESKVSAPQPATSALPSAPESASPTLETAPIKLDAPTSAGIPLPVMTAPAPVVTENAIAVGATAGGLAAERRAPVPTLPSPAEMPKRLERMKDTSAPAVDFKPSKEVYEKVDEKVVAEERSAVRRLLNVDTARELESFVRLDLATANAAGWTYFRLQIRPETKLQPVAKDVVLLLDASGSIGWDRITSIRKAAKRILRSATNSGDRFNLVAFRDRYSYAFRSWQECTQASFNSADKWLNNLAAHGRTDVFSTIASVLTLPRDPQRPLVALVVTDGDANSGVSNNGEILAKFTELNDGLISVYMYGVKSSSNRQLIDVLTHGNRGESFIFEGMRWSAGEGLEQLSERFRDPVLSDLRLVFAADTPAEAYPQRLRNLYRGAKLTLCGRIPARSKDLAFSLKGLNGASAYEGFFRLPLSAATPDASVIAEWRKEHELDQELRKGN